MHVRVCAPKSSKSLKVCFPPPTLTELHNRCLSTQHTRERESSNLTLWQPIKWRLLWRTYRNWTMPVPNIFLAGGAVRASKSNFKYHRYDFSYYSQWLQMVYFAITQEKQILISLPVLPPTIHWTKVLNYVMSLHTLHHLMLECTSKQVWDD
jgi:hypothetical protein